MKMENHTIKKIRTILGNRYGIHVKTAVQQVSLDFIDGDDELDSAALTAYTQLYFLESRSSNIVGISSHSFSILNLVVESIYEVLLKKLLIPSLGMNYSTRYLLGYELTNALLTRDELSSSECLELLLEFSLAFSCSDFTEHLYHFKSEASISGYQETSWLLREFHSIADDPFVMGCMAGISGLSRVEIEVNRISESMNAQEDQ